MADILLSVCVPCYNGEKFLRRAVGALSLDGHRSFECVVADNASTDATPDICRDLAERFNNFSFSRHSSHVDAISNFNRCARLAKGKYLVFLPVDDVLFLDRLVPVIEFLECHEEVGFAYGSLIGVDPEGRLFPMACPGEDLFEVCDATVDRRLAVSRISSGVSILGLTIRKSVFERVGGLDPECELFTEVVFPFLLMESSAFLVHRRFLSAFVNRRGSSYSSRRPEFLEEAIVKLFNSEVAMRLADEYPSMYRTLLLDILRGHFRSGPLRFAQVIRCFWRFICTKPSWRGILVFGLMLASSGPLVSIFEPIYRWARNRKFVRSDFFSEEDLRLLTKAGVQFKCLE